MSAIHLDMKGRAIVDIVCKINEYFKLTFTLQCPPPPPTS